MLEAPDLYETLERGLTSLVKLGAQAKHSLHSSITYANAVAALQQAGQSMLAALPILACSRG